MNYSQAFKFARENGYSLESEDVCCQLSVYAYYFAKDIPGANIEKCLEGYFLHTTYHNDITNDRQIIEMINMALEYGMTYESILQITGIKCRKLIQDIISEKVMA